MIRYGEAERANESCNRDFKRYERSDYQIQNCAYYLIDWEYHFGSSNYFQVNRVRVAAYMPAALYHTIERRYYYDR